MSGIGDSIAHGDEKSAVKNTAPDNRTTRRTSDSTSTLISGEPRPAGGRNGQGFQRVSQPVKQIWSFGQDVRCRSHWTRRSPQARSLSHAMHRRTTMPMLKPDPTFYPSPTMATQSPPERLAYL